MERRTYLLIGLAVLLVVIIAAYLDGGAEPVRPMEQVVEVPALGSAAAPSGAAR